MSGVTQTSRIKELDGIRGIAILMVIAFHYIACQPKILESGNLVYYLLSPLKFCWAGVDLFFVLSGFLIGGITLDNYKSPTFLRVFWQKRLLRILPVLIVLVVLCFAFQKFTNAKNYPWLYDDLLPVWLYLTFTQNIFMGVLNSFGGNFLSITWSLCVEEQFYILAPFLVTVTGEKNCIKLIILLFVISVILQIYFSGLYAYINTVFRMHALLCGFFVAWLFRKQKIWNALNNKRKSLTCLTILVLLIGSFVLSNDNLKSLWHVYFTILFGLVLIFSLVFRASKITKILRSNILGFWGLISYGLYMYHQAISGLLHGWLRQGRSPSLEDQHGAMVTCLAFIVSTLFAYVSYRYYELHFLKIGRKKTY
jgi:peptidoglycan/LPS O-acetylase OafA/YrhL